MHISAYSDDCIPVFFSSAHNVVRFHVADSRGDIDNILRDHGKCSFTVFTCCYLCMRICFWENAM